MSAASAPRAAQRAVDKHRQNPPPQVHSHGHVPNSLNRSLNNGQQSLRSKDGRPPSSSSSSTSSRRSVTPTSRSNSRDADEDNDPGRVRVAVRLRPKHSEELLSADFVDCVECQPELKRLKLRKNNWSSESYKFDEVFTDTASQKRVYEVVAKPVVESVLNGYNGTVMAYGQTGTGKTYTLGRLGKDDASERGIMVRAVEDIMRNTSPSHDSVEVSFLQLYMESIQDLLSPEKTNIPIHEDPKTGEVTVPGAVTVKIQDMDHFIQLLQVGEANRHSANTNLNTESSRSHAILMVHVRRAIHDKFDGEKSYSDKEKRSDLPIVRKSKLLIVDLAGSERLDKSGSEGYLLEEAKFINLSLTCLGKCINALAENSPHIPTRDSKLTRLLRDSFGGSARTSLIVTIASSALHQGETTSTIMFAQRAMKIVNMVKLREEFDYERLCRKLELQIDHLTAEIERQQHSRDDDIRGLEKRLRDCQDSSTAEANKNLVTRSEFLEKENARLEIEMQKIIVELNCQKDHNVLLHDKVTDLEMRTENSRQHQLENSTYQKVLADTTRMYEMKVSELIGQLETERGQSRRAEEQLDTVKKLLSEHQMLIQQLKVENTMYQRTLADTSQMYENKTADLVKQLEDEHARFEGAREQLDLANELLAEHQNLMENQQQEDLIILRAKLKEMQQLHDKTLKDLQSLKSGYNTLAQEKAAIIQELHVLQVRLSAEEKQRNAIEIELLKLKTCSAENEDNNDKHSYGKQTKASSNPSQVLPGSSPSRETLSSKRATIAKICEEVGIQKILQLLASEDLDVQIHAVKVVANLAAEETNQELIMEEGGLDALLSLLRSSQNATVLRVASGAIANLAMNEMNQGLIVSKRGTQLLAKIASETSDPQTLRMVAGALANLCGNEKLHMMLTEDGGIKALLDMAESSNTDVVSQVARGLANYAKCESRAVIKGQRKDRSVLMENGALEWLILNTHTAPSATRRHLELALCHLAQNGENARDFVTSRGLQELVRISKESSRDDIRSLARKTLRSNPALKYEGTPETNNL